jgi:hypothetical protein
VPLAISCALLKKNLISHGRDLRHHRVKILQLGIAVGTPSSPIENNQSWLPQRRGIEPEGSTIDLLGDELRRRRIDGDRGYG